MKLASIREFIKADLSNLKTDNFYRKLKPVDNQIGHLLVNGKKIINFNSNDYLGLAANQEIINNSLRDFNEISQCSSRLVGGNSTVFENLEKTLSMHRKTEASLVYTTGYSAVLGTLSSLADMNTTIFSDELNHASIIDGCRLSCAKIKVFRHNNMEHLLKLLRGVKGKKIIVTEGLFSIEGDMSNLKSICKLAKEFGAFTIIDDAHGDFVFGTHGAGTPSELNVNNLIDIHISSLSKGLGCFGGYDLVRRQLTGLPAAAVAAATLGTSALLILPFAIANWPDHAIAAKSWFSASMLGVVCTGIAFVMYYRLIQRIGAARAVAVTYLVPLFGVAWGWMLLGEPLTVTMVVAAMLILGSVALSQRAAK